ncbi:pyocin immunity protein [Photorhabdus luminescens]|uniref:Pyocin immunity protein n=1 Tax=Photorhabdus luminescens subsp. mexicana TaxID=2100167 RepID=A0A4R4JGS8_PHOLU|nr:DUF6392 family protein [Photorhabdus luminescens]MCW7760436.1 DUF6392 family protein [Photorhabdus luminescens subsp. venezuelensis]OWO84136.1 pyocin immunity protein [Photorhabdus luminescens]TDB53394.1 pyocin immunity protein [Photorhabdus luminescens subsp. mexicana]
MADVVAIINNLGQTVDILVEKQLISAEKFEYIFNSDEEFHCQPEPGLMLVFDELTKKLISVCISLTSYLPEIEVYKGSMPPPFQSEMDKTTVRAILGQPSEINEATEVPIIGMVGGWDVYTNCLKDLYPAINIVFGYTVRQRVSDLTFKRSE